MKALWVGPDNLRHAGLESVKETLRVSDDCEIVARIETKRAIVHGRRELIRLYEEKVKKVIDRVWEG